MTFNIGELPRWLFAIASIMIAFVLFYSLVYPRQPIQLGPVTIGTVKDLSAIRLGNRNLSEMARNPQFPASAIEQSNLSLPDAECPDGQVAVGIKSWAIPPGQAYAVGALTALRVICRPLSNAGGTQ